VRDEDFDCAASAPRRELDTNTERETFVILLAREAPERGESMDIQQLERTAEELVTEGKGLLAADESFGTIEKRFNAVNIDSTEESRRQYREMLFTTEGISEHLSGVILFDETMRQDTSDGRPLPQVLEEQGIIPGIKVDKSTVNLPLSPEEKFTQGLDGLADRLEEYREMGARFTKWRAVITIGDGIPTAKCVEANAQALALYAAFSQEAGFVPIVEPEVLIDGDHSIERSFEVNEWVLKRTYAALYEQRVHLEGTLLKPNFVINGKDAPEQASVEEVAHYTIKCFLRSVPAAVPGIVLLSGGQSDVDATAHLNAMNAMYDNLPWRISFSWARALQQKPMEIWGGDAANIEEAQKVFHHRTRMASVASNGEYSREMEQEQAA
jgi:fructose-bisphosphate aldolase, class I